MSNQLAAKFHTVDGIIYFYTDDALDRVISYTIANLLRYPNIPHVEINLPKQYLTTGTESNLTGTLIITQSFCCIRYDYIEETPYSISGALTATTSHLNLRTGNTFTGTYDVSIPTIPAKRKTTIKTKLLTPMADPQTGVVIDDGAFFIGYSEDEKKFATELAFHLGEINTDLEVLIPTASITTTFYPLNPDFAHITINRKGATVMIYELYLGGTWSLVADESVIFEPKSS